MAIESDDTTREVMGILETAAQQYQVYSELRQLAPETQGVQQLQPADHTVVEPVRDLDYPVGLILEIEI